MGRCVKVWDRLLLIVSDFCNTCSWWQCKTILKRASFDSEYRITTDEFSGIRLRRLREWKKPLSHTPCFSWPLQIPAKRYHIIILILRSISYTNYYSKNFLKGRHVVSYIVSFAVNVWSIPPIHCFRRLKVVVHCLLFVWG